MTEQPTTAEEFAANCGLEYVAEFVPFSKSRHADQEQPDLNWRITLKKGNTKLVTDYSQGVGHIPHYSHQFSRLVVYDAAVRQVCETGKSPLIPHKNGYDACQAGRMVPETKPLPPPSLVEVLSCLVMDASVLDYPTFEEWASEFGYDPDSRKGERIYRECLQIALQLRQLIDLDAARDAFADY